MLRTLYSRLAIALLVIFGAIGLVLAHLISHSSMMYQQEVAQKLNHHLADYISGEYQLMEKGQVDRTVMKDLFHQLMIINPSIELYLLDRNGYIIGYQADENRIKRDKVDLVPINTFLKGEVMFPHVGDDPRNMDNDKVFSVAEIRQDNDLQAYLYIILRGEEFENLAQMIGESYILDNSLMSLLIALISSLLGGLIVFALLTRRLGKLSSVVRRYGENVNEEGKEHIPFPVRTPVRDEIDNLGLQFNTMAQKINLQIQELQKMDSQRREMVANISHDLRTPLTTLRGYLETLQLQDKQLSPNEKKEYLGTALKYSHRLSKLVEELFELARLDSCESVIYSEPFSMSELVQDIVQSFELRAKQSKIHIQTQLNPETPLIYGDIAMMQRVLENLLENALRHTPAQGTIGVSVDLDQGRVRVQVRDSGQGIPPDLAPRIFDRFYQLDTTRGQHGNAGLGLAVVKRILELHGSVIAVSSAINEGTTFSFDLTPGHTA